MSSKLIEHTILAAEFISVYLKCSNSENSVIFSLFTIASVISLYFAFAVDQRWIYWNSEIPYSWFQQLKIVGRQSQTLGLWCIAVQLFLAFLLPTVNCVQGNRYLYSPFFALIIIHCPLVTKLVCFWLLRKWRIYTIISHIFSLSLNFYLLWSFFAYRWFTAAAFSILPSLLDSIVTPKLMALAARSFTLGEFSLIQSSVILALIASIQRISYTGLTNGDYGAILLTVSWSLVSCVSFSAMCCLFPIFRRSALAFWIALLGVVLAASLACLTLNGLDFLTWLLEFLLFHPDREIAYRRWIVLTFWLLCVACTVLFVSACWSLPRLNTVHRKYFHLTIGFVVLSGLLYDVSLTLLSSVLALDAFIVLELIRLLEIEPFGKALRDLFQKFLDHQDQGPLVLTPIYLLIGCFLPLWIDLPTSHEFVVGPRHFAGLIAVGVGDAAAAIGGTYIGRTAWHSNGKKTVEGTTCGFVAQVGVMVFIAKLLGSNAATLEGISWVLWSSFLLSMLETFSTQVDNLVLPLLGFILLICC